MNIAKILKNCPIGIKLYSSIYGEVEFRGITTISENIHCLIKGGKSRYFCSDGKYTDDGECVLFPSKEQRDWNDFMIPFRNGDVIIRTEFNPGCKQYDVAIFSNYNANSINRMTVHCQVNGCNEFMTRMNVCHNCWRLANAEEVRHFIIRMHESGYNFKGGKLITLPNFKVGDTITNGIYSFKITHIDDRYYYEKIGITDSRLLIQEQDKWRIKKFDTCTLKPYDKVLVKNGDGYWYPSLVSYVNSSGCVCIIDADHSADYVIPFEGNEYLVGKFDDPDPYYITWQE